MRCYATIPDFIHDLTGITALDGLPLNTFGFMLAVSIIIAAVVLSKEVRRKEKLGLFHPQIKTVWKGKPATPTELIIQGIIGFIIGFKLLGGLLNLESCKANPQDFIFSSQGNFFGGIILALAFAGFRYYEKNKTKLAQPVEEKIQIWPHDLIGDIALIAALAGVIGAMIFHNIEYWDTFLEDPIGAITSFSGLTIYGGLIIGSAAVIVYAMRNKISVIHLADAAAPTLILAYGIGRLGCFFSGDGDWGIENLHPQPGWLSFLPEWTWAYHFPHNVNHEGIAIAGCTEKYCTALEIPAYPTMIYETVMCLLIFFFLWRMRKRIQIPGMIMAFYLMLNGVERFLIETIRVNPRYDVLGIHASFAQLIAILFFAGGIALAWFSFRRYRQKAV